MQNKILMVIIFIFFLPLSFCQNDTDTENQDFQKDSEEMADEQASSQVDKQLLFSNLPDDFFVYAVGTYRGTNAIKVQLDDSGHEVTQVEVIVNEPEKPVILVLTAYDPVVWRVGHSPETQISGIIVSGYHGQALIGIDKNIPHAISSYMEKGRFSYFYAYDASKQLFKMNEAIKQFVGQEIDHFYHKQTNGIFSVGSLPFNKNDIVYSDDLKIENYVIPNKPLAGQEALEQLVKEKKLRLATSADINAWIEKASEKFQRFNPDLRVRTYMGVGRTYVVLEKLTLPNGLFGAHAQFFIIPDDVPFPDGPRCHNTFYKMDGSSSGAFAQEN